MPQDVSTGHARRGTRLRRLLLVAATAATLAGSLPLAAAHADVDPDASPMAGPVTAGTVPGAARLGTAVYPVPATGAYFVSPTGDDAAEGSSTAPWQSVAHAVDEAPDGATLVLAAGSYHEQVVLPLGKKLTIQNAPGAVVWFDGSVVVSDWVADGGAWRHDGWTTQLDRTGTTFGDELGRRMIDPAYPLAGYPDQVFVDNRELTQVASRSEVVPGTFFADYTTSRLWIGDSPDKHVVHSSDLGEALSLNGGNGSVVRGLGFRRYATTIPEFAAVKGYADDVVFENDVFRDNAMAGLALHGDGNVVRNNSLVNNGQIGLSANNADDALVAANIVRGNDRERFNQIPVAGGIKFTASRHVVVRDNDIRGNLSTGIWFDRSSVDITVVRNISSGNFRHGILMEISAHGILAGNLCTDNQMMGIRVIESNDVDVYNNTLARNWRDFDALEGFRDATLGADGHDPRYPTDMTATFNLTDVQFRNNVLWSGMDTTKMLLNVDDSAQRRSASTMVTADNNAYYRPSADAPSRLTAWGSWPTKMVSSDDLPEFVDQTGQERHGVAVDSATDPFFVNAAGNDFHLRPGSPAQGVATPVPAAVAAALGLSTTTPGLGAPMP